QDRLTEKTFLNSHGIETAPFAAVESVDELKAALAEFGNQGVLKTRRLGYDGKGQRVLRNLSEAEIETAFAELSGSPLILEGFVPFVREISVIAGRNQDGAVVSFDPAENVHRDGILFSSTVPANISDETRAAAGDIASRILEGLGYVGVIGVEFFVLADGKLLVNEIAPRVHNSGHWTLDGATVSQFEQHIRAVAGWPLAKPLRLGRKVEMTNLIGDEVHDLAPWLALPGTSIHLYGKPDARPGRKMGHVTRVWPAK
ncbi:MAG TPA: 5-(carboxyamino)imidazole ribonucleotide synthase, partial [Pseudolabrys sp.]|nr:5-(carboxyamino)imidazole ribonucleotide synthase [Pseudolabrys sp.]